MILDWKKIATKINENLKKEISMLNDKPMLAAVLVWENEASKVYVNAKRKAAESVGMLFRLVSLPEDIDQKTLEKEITSLSEDAKVSWYIVQLPLPNHIDSDKIINLIDPSKDVDWFTRENIWKLFYNDETWIQSCTPRWIKRLLDEYDVELKWKNVTIIWKSNIVWKPLGLLFINHSATVTVCSSNTKDLKEHTLKSDIIVSAVWKPKIIGKEYIKKWSILIDVWITRVDWKLYWDFDFDELEKDNMITPVPWWVWPMTVAMLLENTYLAYKWK